MPKSRNLKRTLTAFFTKKKAIPQVNGPLEEGFVDEEIAETSFNRRHRASFEQRACCFPSWQHKTRTRQQALTFESSQVASASAYNDARSLQSLDDIDEARKSPSLQTHDSSSSVCWLVLPSFVAHIFHRIIWQTVLKPAFMATPEPTSVLDSSKTYIQSWGRLIAAWHCTLLGSGQRQGTLCLMSKALVFRGVLLTCKPKVCINNNITHLFHSNCCLKKDSTLFFCKTFVTSKRRMLQLPELLYVQTTRSFSSFHLNQGQVHSCQLDVKTRLTEEG